MRWLSRLFFPDSGATPTLAWALITLAGGLLGMLLTVTDVMQRAEWSTYDRLVRAVTRNAAPAPDVIVVAIDEPSAAELGRPWPWPRSWHAQLVTELTNAGARAIAFDVVFDSEGPTIEDDEAFASALARSGRVVLASDLVETDDSRYALAQWVDPIEPYAQAAHIVGAARAVSDPDGVVRRAALQVGDRPGLPLAAVTTAGREALAWSDARLLAFNGAPRHGITTVSYYQALHARELLPAGFFRDKVVFVGRSLRIAAGDEPQADHYATPVDWQTPGVEIHATTADALLRGRYVREPFGSRPALALSLLGLALVAGVATRFVSPGLALTGVLGAGVALVIAAWTLLTRTAPIHLPVIGPVVTLATTLAVTTAYRYAAGSRERRMIRRAFQHYVSPAVVDVLLRDPSQLALGGRECEVTVLFTDLEGFSAMSEHLAPEEIHRRLTEHFTEMVEALLEERATLDKFIGDSVMAYFGAPLADPAHAAQACRAALAMQRRMAALTAKWASAGQVAPRVRIGINTGRAVAGNMGTPTVFNYTVLGDTVNLASRLEGVNKAFHTGIIVGPDTRAAAGDAFVFRELDAIRVVGRATPVSIHELVGLAGTVGPMRLEVLRHYADGLAAYRARAWQTAHDAFTAALALDTDDAPSQTMRERVAAYVVEPPDAAWDGVYQVKVK